jgi:hypothetical protein
MKEQSYTSTPPMGRTACTKPQCLYKGALYLYVSFSVLYSYFRLKSIIFFVCSKKRTENCPSDILVIGPLVPWSFPVWNSSHAIWFSLKGSTQLLHLPDWVQSQTSKKKTPVHFCVRVVVSFEIIQYLSATGLLFWYFRTIFCNNATGICHLRLMVELLAFA